MLTWRRILGLGSSGFGLWIFWRLHLLIALALGHRTRPPAIRLALGPFGRTLVTLDKSWPALDTQVVSGIVVKLERRYQTVGRIARIGALRFA